MAEFFKAGGFGMYPTLLFGVLAVASAVALLLQPGSRLFPLVMTLAGTTLGAGLLGFATGAMTTLRYIDAIQEPGEKLNILAAGLGESLHSLVLGLALAVLTGLLASIGALRAAQSAPQVSPAVA